MILETVGTKNTCRNWENILNTKTKKVEIHAIKATLFFCVNQTKKSAHFKTARVENFKPFQNTQKRVAVVKYIMKGKILTLTQQIN